LLGKTVGFAAWRLVADMEIVSRLLLSWTNEVEFEILGDGKSTPVTETHALFWRKPAGKRQSDIGEFRAMLI